MKLVTALVLSRSPARAFAAMGALWGSFAATVPALKAGLGAGDADFGLALFCSAVGLVLAMWLAPLADRRLGALALPLASGALSLAFLGPVLAPGLAWFGLAMLLVGLCSGLTDVVMNARVSELEAVHDAPLMNLNHAMFSLAYMLGAILAGFVREAGLPMLAPFVLFAVAGLLASGGMVQPVALVSDDPDGGQSTRLPWRLLGAGGGIVLLAFLAENAAEGWSALHIERTLGGRPAEGALGPALLGLTMFAGRISGQVVAARLNGRALIGAAALLASGGAALAAGAPTAGIAQAGFALLGLGISVLAPMALALTGRLVAPHQRTRAISRVAVLGFLGFFLGPPLMGLVADGPGLRTAFAMIAGAMLLVPVLLLALPRNTVAISQSRP